MQLKRDDAPIGRRFLAYVLDILIVSLIIYLPLGNIDGLTEQLFTEAELSPATLMIVIASALLVILYWALFEYLLRQTPGKMAVKIKVVSEGSHLTFKQCILRNLTKVSTLLLIIDSIPIFKKRRRLMDHLAKTRVVMQ